MRHKYERTYRDPATGAIIAGATVTVYEENSAVLATIYDVPSGGVALAGSTVTTDANGRYLFYVDEEDYTADKRFKVVITATGYSDYTVDYIPLFTLDEAPSFNVNKGGVDQTIVSATDTLLTWGNEEVDSHGYFASNRFTPLVPGLYIFHLNVRFILLTDGKFAKARIKLNGTIKAEGIVAAASSSIGPASSASIILSLNGTTDYVEAWIEHNEGADKDVEGGVTATWFLGHRIG